MVTLRDYPKNERPRERLVKYGVEALSLQELLALIFGRGTKNQPLLKITEKLIFHFGSLKRLSEASIFELKTIKGIGLAKACQIKACFEIARRLNNESQKSEFDHLRKKEFISPEDIYQAVKNKIINFYKEHFLVVSLDNRNQIINVDLVSVGSLTNSLVHPRETFEVAIKNHAAQIILCHNHPSQEEKPSEEDIFLTKKLVEAGKILGIEVIDHLIITKKTFFSFAQNCLI